MRLALALGRLDVDAMLDEMTPLEAAEWSAYFDMEPVGFFADRQLFIRLSQLIASVNGNDITHGEIERLFALPGEEIPDEVEDSTTIMAKLASILR
jgi:hypothetical protein